MNDHLSGALHESPWLKVKIAVGDSTSKCYPLVKEPIAYTVSGIRNGDFVIIKDGVALIEKSKQCNAEG